tara:strand:- start:376 stop:1155 length:780 start_codon:yes stop_codon:yes gene_type:complete
MQLQYSPPATASRERAMSRFRPGWLPTCVVLLLMPVLIGLGFWQLQRAQEKREIMAANTLREMAAPISLVQAQALAKPAYTRVKLVGRFDAEHSLYLDNSIRDGHVGLEVLQPFFDQASGLWVLLNRGWLAWPDRRVQPTLDTPQGPQSVIAEVYVPLGGGLNLASSEAGKSWPQLISKVTPTDVWQRLQRDGYAYEMRLESGAGALHTGWPVVAMSPDTHTGYAVQWFAMSAALLGLFIYLGLHNARETRHEPSNHLA